MKGVIIYRPVISEKSVQLGSVSKYTFVVDSRANLHEIKSAVENLFKVKVKGVNVANVKGKPKQAGRAKVRRANWKKAIVTLLPGQTIKLFEEKVKDGN
jgi:large subunit ribosomal protein L23